MTVDGLKSALKGFCEKKENLGVCVYGLTRESNDPGPFKLDVDCNAAFELKEFFLQSIRERVVDKEDLSVLNLSSADERMNAIYEYDLDLPEELKSLEIVTSQDNLPVLDLNNQSLSSIKAIIVEIGDNDRQLVLYKTMAPVNIFTPKTFFLSKHKSRLQKVRDEFLRVSANFQVMRVGREVFILDIDSLERNFGFHDVIRREAALGVQAVASADLLANPEVLEELIDDVKYARRLTKVAKASPVLKAGVSGQSVAKFCKDFPGVAGKIRFDGDGKAVLDTKVSKDLFLKILMDDFLTSQLTQLHYTSIAKDAVDLTSEGVS